MRQMEEIMEDVVQTQKSLAKAIESTNSYNLGKLSSKGELYDAFDWSSHVVQSLLLSGSTLLMSGLFLVFWMKDLTLAVVVTTLGCYYLGKYKVKLAWRRDQCKKPVLESK